MLPFTRLVPTCRSKDICVASGAPKLCRVIEQAGCYCVCLCVFVCVCNEAEGLPQLDLPLQSSAKVWPGLGPMQGWRRPWKRAGRSGRLGPDWSPKARGLAPGWLSPGLWQG